MHFSLSADHQTFFNKNGFISFDNLLTSKEVDKICEEITRLVPDGKDLFDLFRQSPLLQKFIQSTPVVRLIRDLFQTKTFRIGYDRLLPDPSCLQTLSLEDCSSAKPLVGGILIPLSSEAIEVFDSTEVFCVSCTRPLAWKEFLKERPYYLITYASANASYYLEPKDPYTHLWKRLGYVFGDRLNQTRHPLCN